MISLTNRDLIGLYRLIAVSLTYPDKAFVDRVNEAIGQIRLELWDEPDLTLGALIEGLRELALLPLDQVQGEHTRLFLAAYPHVPCCPHESAYRQGRLGGEATEQVERLCRDWELTVDGEEVDHAGAELEFTAFLLTMDTPDSLAAARQFRTEHLCTWLPDFAADLSRESRLGFYRAVATLLSSIVGAELVRL